MDMEVFNAKHQATATHFKDIAASSPNYQQQEQRHQEKKLTPAAPEQQQVLKCPRCESSNTKFCYYNNYSLSQPRYLCKACRRYWTHGGSLRNVPVGGGCRKSKKSSSSSKKSQSNRVPALPLPPLPYEPNGHFLGSFNVDSSGAYCGFGIPFDSGMVKSNEEEDDKLMMTMTMMMGSVHGLADIGGGADRGGNVVVDPVLGDWTSGVGSSWHGLVNSSFLM